MPYEDREMLNLAHQLNQHPDTRPTFLKITKMVRPDVAMPELEIEERVNTQVQALQQEIATLKAQKAEKEAIENLDAHRKNLYDKGLAKNKDDINRIEKIMLDKNIVNHETAAEFDRYMREAAVPTPSGYNPNPMRQFDLKAFHKNPIQAARDVAAQALTEIRKPVRPIGL